MYHIYMILLHRPFLTKVHHYSPEISILCLEECISAAIRISYIVHCYCAAFTVRRAPYFIAYSAFVAATILIRVAALPQVGASRCRERLKVCLSLLQQSERTNSGAKRANAVVRRLCRGARLDRESQGDLHDLARLPDILVGETHFDLAQANVIIDGFAMTGRDANTRRQPSTQHTSPRHTPSGADRNLLPTGVTQDLQVYPPATNDAAVQQGLDGFNDMIFGLHGDLLDQWADLSPYAEHFLHH